MARERFNFSDGRDVNDIRLGFGYQSRVSRELSDLQAEAAYQSIAASAQKMSASTKQVSAPPLSAGERARLGSMEAQFGQNLAQSLVIASAASPPALIAQMGVAGYALGSSFRNGEYREAGFYAGLMGVDLLLAGGGSRVVNALRSETQIAGAELNSALSEGFRRDLPKLAAMDGISPAPKPKFDIPSYDELKDLAANSLDFGTKRDGALFWSGTGNMTFAKAYGTMTGRTTLEQTSGGQYLVVQSRTIT